MLYFAYGANLHRAHMKQVAPSARVVGVATLAHHRVAIGRAGYGTLLPAPGVLVYGLLWDLTETDEQELDVFEGIKDGFYRKDVLPVTTAEGTFRAMAYIAVDGEPGMASPDYVRHVLEGARAAGFPAEYLAELAALPADEAAGGPWVPPSER